MDNLSQIYRKTIKIFLVDGLPTGRMSAELSNWTGKAYKIPRNRLKDCKDRPDLNGTGVYFLFGEDNEGNNITYIGEAEDVLKRLNNHLREKDFWTEVIVLISKDDNLNKAHIKYLEHHFYLIAKEAGRYVITNETIPALPLISESDEAEMEEFMVNSKLLIGTLGHNIFEKTIERGDTGPYDEKVFYIKAARGADARMIPTSEGFVVVKDSEIANPVVKSFPTQVNKIRNTLIENGKIQDRDGKLTLTDDHIFSSASTAASFVMGRSANGLTEWKLKSGITLKEVEGLDE